MRLKIYEKRLMLEMRKKVVILGLIAVLIVTVQFMFLNTVTNAKLTKMSLKSYSAVNKEPSEEEAKAAQFLQLKMLNSQGIIPYLVTGGSPATYGVSESIGQAMEYAALLGDATLFAKYAAIADRYFKAPTGYFYWKIDIASHKGETSSALVDDLRIAKAYLFANEGNMGDYREQIAKLAQAIYEFDVDANGYPCDYYDGALQKKADEVSLFYLDVETMEKLSKVNPKWSVPHNKAIQILVNVPDNRYGFYPQTFKINAKEYVWPASVNMVENLYTAMDVQYAGKSAAALVQFLKGQIKKGKIYNHYNLDGTSAGEDESTAVYALATRFLAMNNERKAADWCYHRTLDFQINEQEALEGGFGEPETGLVYAFDQLEALLMLRMVEIKNDSQ